MLLTTVLRELWAAKPFERVPEPDVAMDGEDAVAAFVRAGRPGGILSGVHAFYTEQACRMIRPGDRVLDLGCGPASLLAAVAALNEDCTFVGVDLSARMVAAGEQVLRQAGLRHVALRVDDMTELSSVASASVDVVLSSMALHHLANAHDLRRCFGAVRRVMRPRGRVFMVDFGRLRSPRSVEYFVRRAIPEGEPVLQRDYRASLRAAFSKEELGEALPEGMKGRTALYATAVSPMMLVLTSPFPDGPPREARAAARVVEALPRARRADYAQLTWFLRLGGMPVR